MADRKKLRVRLRKGYQTNERFLASWKRIRVRTRYRVELDTGELVEGVEDQKIADRIHEMRRFEDGELEEPACDLLRPIEHMKLECGRRHFTQFEEVRFQRVGSLRELVE